MKFCQTLNWINSVKFNVTTSKTYETTLNTKSGSLNHLSEIFHFQSQRMQSLN